LIRSLFTISLRASSAACLIVLAVMSGCSASAAECQTEQKCNELGSQTVSQCQSSGDQCISQLQQGNASCQALATKVITYNNCASGLTCSERQDITTSSCSSQFSDVLGAAETAVAAGCPACGSGTDGG